MIASSRVGNCHPALHDSQCSDIFVVGNANLADEL
jgi:hypothetical protein